MKFKLSFISLFFLCAPVFCLQDEIFYFFDKHSPVKRSFRNKRNNNTITEFDRYGYTKLFLAVYWNDLNEIEKLLNHGAYINQQNAFGQTPLHIAMSMKNIDIIEILITHGARLDIEDDDFKKPYDCFDDEEVVLSLRSNFIKE